MVGDSSLFYFLSAAGFGYAAWLARRPKPKGTAAQKIKDARQKLLGDPNNPERIEKARLRALKFRYAGMDEAHVLIASIICAVLFFGIYVFFSRSIIVGAIYALFGYQIPNLVVDVMSTVNVSKGFGQIADMISSFTDARELKMTISASLSAAGRAVTGPPLGDDIRTCLRRISMDASEERESLRQLGIEVNNHHLVNFADLIQEVKKSGVEDSEPFRMLDWVIQEEDKLQEELYQAIMAYMVFLAIFSLVNLASIPLIYFAYHSVWAIMVGIPILMYVNAGAGLLMMKGIRDYATKRVVV